MFLALFILATFPAPSEEVKPSLLVAALRPEDIQVPPPKVKAKGPGFPRRNMWPNPNRRFTRKG